MKTQSPSGSRGRAGVRISNLPPWLSLLCMVIYMYPAESQELLGATFAFISNNAGFSGRTAIDALAATLRTCGCG